MNNPLVRPSHIACGACGASTALLWEPAHLGVCFGHARCSCGAGLVSIFSESGIPLEAFSGLFSSFSDGEKGGFGSLIA